MLKLRILKLLVSQINIGLALDIPTLHPVWKQRACLVFYRLPFLVISFRLSIPPCTLNVAKRFKSGGGEVAAESAGHDQSRGSILIPRSSRTKNR